MAVKHRTPMTDDVTPADFQEIVFSKTASFKEEKVTPPSSRMTAKQWRHGLRKIEIKDNMQKLKARPLLAWGVGLLLVAQNIGIYYIIMRALEMDQLKDLQLIFGTLIAGSLTQSYFLLRLITEKVFGNIDYHYRAK